MNTFQIKFLDRDFAEVEYTIGNTVFSEKYDARYLPIDDAEALNIYFQKQLAGYIKEKEVVAVVELPTEVKAMVNEKTDFDGVLVEKVLEEERLAKIAAEVARAAVIK